MDNVLNIPNAVLMPEIARLLLQGRTVTLPLKGNSMRPYLVHKRDKALLVKPGTLHVGDVVLAEVQPKHYVLHRVIRIDGDGDAEPSSIRLTLRGDGNYATESCRASDVIAVAKAFFRRGSEKAEYVSSFRYRAYSWFWMHTFPIRRYLLKLHDIMFHSLKDLSR